MVVQAVGTGLKMLGEAAAWTGAFMAAEHLIKKGATVVRPFFRTLGSKLAKLGSAIQVAIRKVGGVVKPTVGTVIDKLKAIGRKIAEFVTRHPKATVVGGAAALGAAALAKPEARKAVKEVGEAVASLGKGLLIFLILFLIFQIAKR